MRGFDCVAPDGSHPEPTHFEAEDDAGIVEKAKPHVAEHHGALGLTEEQLAGMVAAGSYEINASAG